MAMQKKSSYQNVAIIPARGGSKRILLIPDLYQGMSSCKSGDYSQVNPRDIFAYFRPSSSSTSITHS